MFKFKTLITFALILTPTLAMAQSRVGSQSQPVNRIWLDKPSEIDTISRLINQGQKEKALERAQEFADLEATGVFRYESLNVLCIAQTANGLTDAALKSCTKAIDIKPKTWIAYNSRGGAHYAAGDFEDAIEDYSTALKLYPKSDVIKFNLTLAQGRLGT